MAIKETRRITGALDDMDNSDRVRILEIIDQFRAKGINEDISLPQLVVVGDQSSGKSSLLEGLTGMSFPIASDLCTRYATQIVLRRTSAEDAGIKVSILPGPSANGDEEKQAHLLGFGRIIEGEEFGSEQFAAILDEAAVHMGLPSSKNLDVENLEKRFSDDILKIELSGPQHHHLSVVDVPGLFHNPTKYQTKEDLVIIRNLIEGYITDTRTIILAVMDARNNLANQEVFRMARAADPQGTRTVGIITKCDAVQDGDEAGVLKIAQNTVETLNHGWFAVKNRSTMEIQEGVTIEQRHVNEQKFFNTTPWSNLPKDRVGIAPLKKFLAKLLYDHIRSEFPGLVQEIRSLVKSCREELDTLGPSRQTSVEQRQFVTRLGAKYQRGVSDSLIGNYNGSLDADHPLKLRMHLQNANENFGKKIERDGHTRAFRTVDDSVDPAYESKKQVGSIYEWIRQLYRQSRGSELPGTVNPSVLESMFRQQSASWDPIATDHISSIHQIICDFNESHFGAIVTEDVLRSRIEYHNEPFVRNTKSIALEQVSTILRDEREGILQTINHYFAETLAKMREDRVLDRLRKVGLVDGDYQTIDMGAITRAAHLSNEDQAVNDIHDILKSYYKVALKRFMDNIIVQVVERYYLGPEGPVKALSPEYFGGLSDAALAEIAAESYATSSMRNDVSSKLSRLEEALKMAEDVRW